MSFSLLAFSLSSDLHEDRGDRRLCCPAWHSRPRAARLLTGARDQASARMGGRAPERAADMEQKVSAAASARAQQQTPAAQAVRPRSTRRADPRRGPPPPQRLQLQPQARRHGSWGEPVPAPGGPAGAAREHAAGHGRGHSGGPGRGARRLRCATTDRGRAPRARSGANPLPPATPIAPVTAAGAAQSGTTPAPAAPKPIPWQQPAPAGARPGAVPAPAQRTPARRTVQRLEHSARRHPLRPPLPQPQQPARQRPVSPRQPPPLARPRLPEPRRPHPRPPRPGAPTPPSEEAAAKRVQARSGVTGAPVSRTQPGIEAQTPPARSARDRTRASSRRLLAENDRSDRGRRW